MLEEIADLEDRQKERKDQVRQELIVKRSVKVIGYREGG